MENMDEELGVEEALELLDKVDESTQVKLDLVSDKVLMSVFFVCGVSLTSGQLIIVLFPDCTRSCFSQVVLRRRGGDHIYEMRCLFVAVGLNALYIVLSHWDNMS